jgi:hypothetical protein
MLGWTGLYSINQSVLHANLDTLVLPRCLVSHIYYIQLLKGILQVVQASGCCHIPTATTTNEWRVAFDAVYGSVLSDFSIPSGKNRYHKFRDKIVEIWKAMEENEEMTPNDFWQNMKERGEYSPKDAMFPYGLAAEQYGFFQRSTEERKFAAAEIKASILVHSQKKAPSSSSPNGTSRAESVPATTSNATPATGTKKRPAVGVPPTTSPAVATTQRAPAGFATAARASASNSNNMNESEWPEVLLSKLETITVLLQTANNNPQMPLKLPNMLNDLHRLRARTTDPVELAIMKPYYLDLLSSYLQALEYKIRPDSVVGPHPGALVIDLEGMDLLRQGLRNDTQMLDVVQTTYRKVLIKYLKIVNPRIPAAEHKKRPRET